jgi:hypothetical protein
MKNCRVFCGRVSQNSWDYKIVDCSFKPDALLSGSIANLFLKFSARPTKNSAAPEKIRPLIKITYKGQF